MANYCEDYPCCGHTPSDPCDPRSAITEPWYCDDCGCYHYGTVCEYYEDDEPEVDDDFPMSMEYNDDRWDGYEDSWLDGSYEE